MKKAFIAIVCLFAMTNMQAQVVESDFSATETDLKTTANTKTADNNGLSIDFRIPDGGVFGYSISYTLMDYLNLGYFQDWLDAKGMEKNQDFGIFAGGMYRYWVAAPFFVEGRAGIDCHNHSWSIKVPYRIGSTIGEKTESDDDFSVGFYVEPRIGVKVYEKNGISVCANAGYRLDAMKFKFDDEHLGKYITFGATIAF